VISLDLPTSHVAMTVSASDDFTGRMLDAVNSMLMDMLAAVARKDFDDRCRRQAEGIEKAKAQGVYRGRAVDAVLHQKFLKLREKGFSIRKTVDLAGCGVSTVQRALKLCISKYAYVCVCQVNYEF